MCGGLTHFPGIPVLIAIGCSGAESERFDSGDLGTAGNEPELQESPESLWSVEDVASELQHFIDLGPPNGRDITRVFAELMTHGEGACPGSADSFIDVSNLGCETPGGYSYAGVAWLFVGLKRQGDGAALEWIHGGDFEINRPDGTFFGGGGDMYQVPFLEEDATVLNGPNEDTDTLDLAAAVDGQQTWFLDVHGSWVDTSREDWLGTGFSGVLIGSGSQDTDTGEGQLWLHGGLAVDDVDVFYDRTLWYGDDRCPQGVVGTLRIRDPRGYWYAWELDEDCDSCGTLTFHEDQSMGELCMDLGAYARQTYEVWAPN